MSEDIIGRSTFRITMGLFCISMVSQIVLVTAGSIVPGKDTPAISVAGFVVLSLAWSLMVIGCYFLGRARGYEEAAMKLRRIEEAENEHAMIFDDLSSLVLRYRELATTAAIIQRPKHDYVFLWCKDGIHHGMHVKPGDGATLVQLLGLKPLELPGGQQGAYVVEDS